MVSAGYGSDQVEAISILSAVRSEGNLAVAVLLKPFSFEGRKRLEEVVFFFITSKGVLMYLFVMYQISLFEISSL